MKNTIKIREFLESDRADLVAIDHNSTEIFYSWAKENDREFSGFPPSNLDELFDSARCLVAVKEGDVVGFIFYKIFQDEYVYIAELGVDLAHQGQKIGVELVNAVIQINAAFKKCTLTTYSHVPWNAPYYKKHLGFEIMEEKDFPSFLAESIKKEKDTFPFDPENRVGMIRDLT